MTVAQFVCMVSKFCIVQFVIAMTITFYSETSIKRTPNLADTKPGPETDV